MITRSKPVISNQDAQALLMQAKNHPLWNKEFRDWTEQDVQKLTKYIAHNPNERAVRILREREPYEEQPEPKEPKPTTYGRKCILIRDGEEFEFDSIVKAAAALEIPRSRIYDSLNGRTPKGSTDVWVKGSLTLQNKN